MHTRFSSTAALVAVFLAGPAALVGCSSTPRTRAEMLSEDRAADEVALAAIGGHPFVDLCDRVPPGVRGYRCHAKMRANAGGAAVKESAPSGLSPADLRDAYNLPSSGGNGKIVAIVDAYDNPAAESELTTYRSQFGLLPCTAATGCFEKVAQDGSSNLPQADPGWAGEIALDVQMASAACPDCRILLVEANSASPEDMSAAVNQAALMGASAISNSYGGEEGPTDDRAYDHPGILVTASSGDSGYGANFPATSQYVLAVGGTSLTRSGSSRGWAESAWSDGGSGCSSMVAKPSWQTDTGCSMRSEVDIAAVADPNTGVAVFHDGSWIVYGGTSAASPIVAAMFTLLGVDTGPSSSEFAWSHSSSFFDITAGSNGTCSPAYLCNAGPGFDGPTGWGTPNGAALGRRAASTALPPFESIGRP